MKPRTAICRGAVHKGFAEDQRMGAEDDDDDFMRLKTLNIPLPITVTSTIARYSLGTVHYSVFDPTEHDESDPDYAWDSDTCQYVVHNRVTWYIRKGDNVSKIHPVRHSWIRHLKANFKGSLTHSMVQCANSKPPRRVDDTVKPLCGLKFTPDVKVSNLKPFRSPDGRKTSKILNYDLEMVPQVLQWSSHSTLMVGSRYLTMSTQNMNKLCFDRLVFKCMVLAKCPPVLQVYSVPPAVREFSQCFHFEKETSSRNLSFLVSQLGFGMSKQLLSAFKT